MPQGPRKKNGTTNTVAPPTIEQFLDELTFRGIGIPATHIESSYSHSIVEHKPVDRDGAYVESTGRDPYRVSVTAMFSNHLIPGPDATWTYGNLYPYQVDKVRNACRNRAVGVIKHPSWGQFDAKVVDWRETLDPQNRSGVQVQITFIETIPPTFDAVTTATNATAAAVAYDLAIAALPKGVALPKDKPNFQDTINGIKGAIDGTALKITSAIAKINRVLYNIDRVNDSLDAFHSNVVIDTRIKGERLYESALKLRATLNQSFDAKVRRFLVARDMTMVQLTMRLGNDVPNLLQLNPFLVGMKGSVIPQGTLIRYERVIG